MAMLRWLGILFLLVVLVRQPVLLGILAPVGVLLVLLFRDKKSLPPIMPPADPPRTADGPFPCSMRTGLAR